MRKVPLESFETLGETLGLKKPAAGKTCDYPACKEKAEYRAPKSPAELKDYYWFCLQHVSEYNKAWNYYKGLTEDEIEQEIQRDVLGRRPTWPFAMRVGRTARDFGAIEDDFREAERPFEKNGKESAGSSANHGPRRAEERALQTLQLSGTIDMTNIKERYKALAKKYHPDANDGDPAAEDRLKAINEAYTVLKKTFGAPPHGR